MDENKLANDILDLRNQSVGKGFMYIILKEGEKDIPVFSPKRVLEGEDRDGFIKFILESAEFKGKVKPYSDVWKTLIVNPEKRDYYRFLLSDSALEITTVKLSEIIKTPL